MIPKDFARMLILRGIHDRRAELGIAFPIGSSARQYVPVVHGDLYPCSLALAGVEVIDGYAFRAFFRTIIEIGCGYNFDCRHNLPSEVHLAHCKPVGPLRGLLLPSLSRAPARESYRLRCGPWTTAETDRITKQIFELYDRVTEASYSAE